MAKRLPIWLALDNKPLESATELVAKVHDRIEGVKIHTLFDQYGSQGVKMLRHAGAEGIWVDAKIHDIPNTAKDRAKIFADAGANIITIHASGGPVMIRAVCEEVQSRAMIYAVTILTSLSDADAEEIYGRQAQMVAVDLARMAKGAGVDGVICSPLEIGVLAKISDLKGLSFIVPGSRSPDKSVGDQKRVSTPYAALKAGATGLVIGRQVTAVKDPIAALDELEREIGDLVAE